MKSRCFSMLVVIGTLFFAACTQSVPSAQAPTQPSSDEMQSDTEEGELEIQGLSPPPADQTPSQETVSLVSQVDTETLKLLIAQAQAKTEADIKALTAELAVREAALKTELEKSDLDIDLDGVPNKPLPDTPDVKLDNCPDKFNPKQEDTDNDGIGNVCDDDRDGDGIPNEVDNCLLFSNPDQTDTDKDKLGDACDPPDSDNDGWKDALDNCPAISNSNQRDTDNDGIGDVCDLDLDNDGVDDKTRDAYGDLLLNPNNNLPVEVKSTDLCNVGDNKNPPCTSDLYKDCCLDNCMMKANTDQANADHSEEGDVCDNDLDGDGTHNNVDNCPGVPNPDQTKTLESAKFGDACNDDIDNDDIKNDLDNCPNLANKDQLDSDADKMGEACDPDNDNDGVANKLDACPTLASIGSGGDPRKCNDAIEGVLNTILSPPAFNNRDYEGLDWRNYIKDYDTEPKGFYAITGLSAIKVYNGKDAEGEDYKVFYVSLFKKPNVYIAKFQIVDGQVVPALTVSYPVKTDFITSMQTMTIGAGVNKKTYLLFLTESIVNDLSPLSTENLWRVEIQPEDYGRILLHTLTKIDLGTPFQNMDVSYKVPFNQLSLGIKEKEDGTGAVAFISQPQSGVVYAVKFTPQPDGTIQTSAPESLSITGIQMVEPRSTFVTGTYLYIGTNGSIVRASLDENGNLIQSSILVLPLDPSVKSSPIGGFAKLDSDSQIFFNIHGNRWIYPFPAGGTSSLYAISNMGQIKRITRSDLTGTCVGYGDFVPGTAEPALVGMHTPAGMSSDGNHLLIADKGNRAIRDIELAVTKQSVSVKKSSYVVGQISDELTHLPKDGRLNNFYWPNSIVVAHEKGSPTSYAFVKSQRGITRFGGHGGLCSTWKATLREDVVETMEQISIACWEYSDMALYNAPDEFRLYTFSPSGNSLEVMTFDKKDGSPKIPSTTIYHHTSFLLKFAATPNGKHLFAIEKPGNDIRKLVRLDLDAASATTPVSQAPVAYGSPAFPWTTPTNISIYTEGSKDYLLVIDKSVFNPDWNISHCTWDWSNDGCSDRLYRVEIGANGDLVPETVELLAGGGTKPPTKDNKKDGVDPLETRFISLGTAKYVDGTIWITHPRHETSIYKLDLNKKKVHFVFQVPWHRYLPFDGEDAQIGADWMGLHTFDVLQFGNIKGLLFLDTRNHALRLLR